MAQRHVTLDLSGIGAFQSTWKSSLQAGAILVPASAIDGELAPEFKADIRLPFGGQIGPLRCQTIQRLPDGSVAGQIPELSARDRERMQAIITGIQEVRAWLLESGELVEPGAAPQAPLEPVPEEEEEDEDEPSEHLSPPPEDPEDSSLSSLGPEDEDTGEYIEDDEEVESAAQDTPAPLPPQHRSRPDGFALPQGWAAAKPTMQGTLSGKELRDGLLDLAMTGATGVLHVQTEGVERHGLLIGGRVMGWRRSPLAPGETLGGLLIKSGRLQPAALEAALETVRAQGKRLGRVLIDAGALPEAQLPLLLQKQAEFVLQLVLRGRAGDWRFIPAPLDEVFPHPGVNVLDMLYRALNTHAGTLPPERILGAVRGQLNLRSAINPAAQDLVDSVQWGALERGLLDAIAQDRPLMRNLFRSVDASREQVAASLWALGELGILSFGQEKRSATEQARFLRQLEGPIRERLARLDAANPFDCLDVSWICSQEDVEASLQRWQARFDPQRFTQLPPSLREGLEKIQAAHDQAFHRINTQAKRNAVRLELFDEDTLREAAELLVSKAQDLESASERRAAYAKALDLVPDLPGAQP